MSEQYYWWWNGVKRLSKSEIRRMKENMQKTPLVQEKSNKYHRLEEQKAEKLLNNIVEEINITDNNKVIEENTDKKLWLIEKIKKYLFW